MCAFHEISAGPPESDFEDGPTPCGGVVLPYGYQRDRVLLGTFHLFALSRRLVEAPEFLQSSAASFARGKDVAKGSASLVGAFALLIVVTSAAGVELRVAGGLIEIEFVRSASVAWESVARTMG